MPPLYLIDDGDPEDARLESVDEIGLPDTYADSDDNWHVFYTTMSSDTEHGDSSDAGVQLGQSAQPSSSNEIVHPLPSHGNNSAAFITGTASQQSSTAVNGFFAPLDNEGDDPVGIRLAGNELTPPVSGEGIPNEESDDTDLPFVPIEQYVPGENDMMSGAVSLHDDISADLPANGNIISTFQVARQQMPYKVLRRHQIFNIGLPFTDERWLEELPRGFLTTFRGLDRAVEEFQALDREISDEKEADVALLGMIVKRGGFPPKRFQQVIYPEEIIPFDYFQLSPDGNFVLREEQEARKVQDEEYWVELGEQGQIWDEIYDP